MSFALFLAENVHLSVGEEFYTFPCQTFAPLSLLLDGAEFALSVAKNVALFCQSSKHFPFFILLLSNGVREDRSTETNDRISGCTVLLLIEKMNQIKGCVERSRHGRHFCSLVPYFLLFRLHIFQLCSPELHPLIRFFFKNSFSKKNNIRKTIENALAPSIFIILSIVLKLGTPILHTQAQNTLLQNF